MSYQAGDDDLYGVGGVGKVYDDSQANGLG